MKKEFESYGDYFHENKNIKFKTMKNIHLLPTDKPSRLCYVICTEKSTLTLFEDAIDKASRFFPQNIYITSDEEIKQRDWSIDKNNVIYKQESDKIFPKFTKSKKIILTTDPDLIADGVQAIDDEFLEWFVKNPSFDRVDVERIGYDCIGECGICDYSCRRNYKIIIPQEEAKQENKKVCTCKRAYVNILSGICSLCWNEKFPDEKEEINEDDLLEPKQESNIIDSWLDKHTTEEERSSMKKRIDEEYKDIQLEEVYLENVKEYAEQKFHHKETLEDAAENHHNTFTKDLSYAETRRESFIEGAKWQAKRMYSEEEVKKMCSKAWLKQPNTQNMLEEFEKWFEKFKKK